jgi:dihydroorotase
MTQQQGGGSSILLKGGRIIDNSQQLNQVGDLLIRGGQVVGLVGGYHDAEEVIDVSGKIVTPGWIDLRVALREPGFEEDETIASGTKAALAGGFSSIAAMPDTDPTIDSRADVEFVLLQAERARNCRVFPIGAVTKGLKGEELAEIGQIVSGGAVALSDAKHPLVNAEVMRRALEYTSMFKKPIMHHAMVPELVGGGVMHEGDISLILGMPGMPSEAESIMVNRDLALAKMTNGRLHLMGISTAESVSLIRQAKQQGVKVTCDVTVHHLYLTHSSWLDFDNHYKINPPFRTQTDIDALIAGLKDGTIDAICTDHQPYALEKIQCEIDQVPFGLTGLETFLPICKAALIDKHHLSWEELIPLITIGPAKVLGVPFGTLQPGAQADITIIDPDKSWTVDTKQFKSQGANNPYDGMEVSGKVEMVFVQGQMRFPL